MRAVGLVVEYNPFHNGHKYHLEKAREVSGAEIVIAVMSGDYTQRGEVACFNRWKRAEMALENGVDLIVELPVFYSSQSAEIFSRGAVNTLSELGVDRIVFGSESGDLDKLEKIADLEENEKFKESLGAGLKLGLSYPTAFSAALREMEPDLEIKSNDILGIEYIKAAKKLEKEIELIPIKRVGVGYHETTIQGEIASATGIRRMFRENIEVEKVMPRESHMHIQGERMALLEEYYPLIRYEIINNFEKLKKIQDIEEGFENRVFQLAIKYSDFEEFFQELVTKRYTIGRLQRILIHILVGLTTQITAEVKERVPYIRVLGFSRNGQRYLKELKRKREENFQAPSLLVGLKNIKKILGERDRELLEFNERASLIYRMVNNYEDIKNIIIK